MGVPLHVVAAAIMRDGRVLAARRPSGKRHGGKWELPGGKVEAGETEEVALAREIREELLCDVRPITRLGESEHDGLRLCGWRCELVGGEPTTTEHSEIVWLAADEIGRVDWVAADLPLLALLSGA